MVPLYNGWDVFETMVPHVLSLRAVFLRYKPVLFLKAKLQFAELLAFIGPYLYERGLHSPGLAVLSTAEEICIVLETKPTKADGPETVGAFQQSTESMRLRANIMAYTWGLWTVAGGIRARAQARVYAAAIVALREELVSRHKTSERRIAIADDILLANAYNDLAFQCLDEARYDEAEPLIHRSMEIKGRLDSAGPQFEYATPMKDLALIRLAQGRWTEALKLCGEAKDLVEAEEGTTSASTQLFRFMLAIVMYNTATSTAGVGAAMELHESVLAFQMAKFGERGCVTLHSRFWVALCCWRMGEHRLARESVLECLADDAASSQWPEECAIRARYLFALILLGSGDGEEGLSVLEKARGERDALLVAHAPELLVLRDELQPGFDEFVLFDHLVNTEAGRTSAGKMGSCGFA